MHVLLSANDRHSVTLEPTWQLALKVRAHPFQTVSLYAPSRSSESGQGHGAVLFTSVDCTVLWGTSRMTEGYDRSQSGSASVRTPHRCHPVLVSQPRVLPLPETEDEVDPSHRIWPCLTPSVAF